MNGDDKLGTVNPTPPQNNPGQLPLGGTDETPDTHWVFEDRIFGGAGLDILIANTKGDRLIDWVGEFNSYIVPFAPFGIATVSRQVPPHLFDFLYGQAFSDGVDVTRNTDTGQSNHNQRYSNVVTMQGGIYGEMGLVTQQDHGFWQDQTGGPTDPQAGNVPGGRRDVLRTSDFNNGSMDLFVRDKGNFAVTGGRLQVSAAIGQQASAFYNLDAYLPIYYEVHALISADKPTGGFKANAYIIFDYQSDIDFKYAGINISNNKIEMGYRDATGWHQLVQSNKPVQLKGGTQYDVLVAVNGTNVTVSVAGVNHFSYTFAPRLDELGQPIPLNKGLVGIGMDSGSGTVDNFKVQILPPNLTLDRLDDFTSDVGLFTGARTGSWTLGGGTYQGAPSGTVSAISPAELGAGLQPHSYLELEAKLRTTGTGGIVFDRYADNDYKFVAIDVVGDKLVFGHVSPKHGLGIDYSVARTFDAGVYYTLNLIMKGASVSATVNGALVGSWGFNSAVVDGGMGVLGQMGATTFDSTRIRTNDPAFASAGVPLLATQASLTPPPAEASLAADQVELLKAEALQRLAASDDAAQVLALGDIDVRIADLPGLELGAWRDGVIQIDIDAAGYGWFVDATPADDREFDGSPLFASSGAAAGHMDLLSVLAHELGHAAGLNHADSGVMHETLRAGERSVLAMQTAAPAVDASGPAAADDGTSAPTPSQATAVPVIDLTFRETGIRLKTDTTMAWSDWVRDFVNPPGAASELYNPNAGLKIKAPAGVPSTKDQPGRAAAGLTPKAWASALVSPVSEDAESNPNAGLKIAVATAVPLSRPLKIL
jgi:hypothetical protein